jgi:hypothetical protein
MNTKDFLRLGVRLGEATGFIPAPDDKGKPITVIGTNSLRAGFDAGLKSTLYV